MKQNALYKRTDEIEKLTVIGENINQLINNIK